MEIIIYLDFKNKNNIIEIVRCSRSVSWREMYSLNCLQIEKMKPSNLMS